MVDVTAICISISFCIRIRCIASPSMTCISILPVTPWEATLGASVEVPTLAGEVRLKIPPGTAAGQKLRLAKRGLPKPHGGEGDLFAIVQIAVPTVGERARAGAVQRACGYFHIQSAGSFQVRRCRMTADDFEADTLWLDTHHEITYQRAYADDRSIDDRVALSSSSMARSRRSMSMRRRGDFMDDAY
jgi:DnaJ-class molecular chaperone